MVLDLGPFYVNPLTALKTSDVAGKRAEYYKFSALIPLEGDCVGFSEFRE